LILKALVDTLKPTSMNEIAMIEEEEEEDMTGTDTQELMTCPTYDKNPVTSSWSRTCPQTYWTKIYTHH